MNRFRNIAEKGLLLLFLVLSQVTYAENFRHIGISQGLSQLSVVSIYQDTLGRMWFGTKEGVSVYDGNTIVSYKASVKNHPKSRKSIWLGNEISTIKGDCYGDVYLRSGSSLVRYNIKKDNFHIVRNKDVHAMNSYKGDIWCVFEKKLHLYDHENDSLKIILNKSFESVNCLTVTQDKFYIGCKNGVYIIDRQSHSIKHLLNNISIYEIFESSYKDIWIGSRMDGLFRMDKNEVLLKIPYSPDSDDGISSMQIRNIVEDDEHNIWFGTFNGLQKYNSHTGKYSLIRAEKKKGGLNHPSVFGVYKDRQNVIWIGSYFGGVDYFNPYKKAFSRYNYEPFADKDLFFSYMGEMAEDNDGNIWICTDGGGLACLNQQTHSFTTYKSGGNNSIAHNNLKSICYDSKRDALYIGTYLGGLSKYDLKKKTFFNYLYQGKKYDAIGDLVEHVKVWNDRLYFSSNKGFCVLNPETDEIKRIHSDPYCLNFDIDEHRYAWLALPATITGVNLNKPSEKYVLNLRKYDCHSRPTKVQATPSGIYVGTLGDGLIYYDFHSRKMINYSTKNSQLLSDYCYSLELTQHGNLIITSNKGITLFSPSNQTFLSLESSVDFPAPAIIKECGIFATSNNEIFVGDLKGLTVFSENDLKVFNEKTILYFSKLWVNNQEIYPDDDMDILSVALPFAKELSLKHDQNNISLSFAIQNYSDIQNVRYEYQLEGFDKRWIPTKRMELSYTNLDPGKYTLHIRTLNNNIEIERLSLPITISTPWYNSFWSWILYISIVLALLIYYIRNRSAKKELALSLEKEQFEKEQIEQATQSKLLFFTNISHEFRTPLTLITHQVDYLLQQSGIPAAIFNRILKIQKNTQQMLNLVSDLLDFRKFEQNHVTLKISQQNIVPFIHEIYYSFYDYALQHNIQYTITFDKETILCWFDTTQMEKVFFNLLSNAFKHTADGGNIQVEIISNNIDILIKVKDNGRGIDSNEIPYIFNRFYQGNNAPKILRGTGIGLALTKNVVEHHHGLIFAESELGKGSTFSVQLLLGKDHFNTDNIAFIDSLEEINSLSYHYEKNTDEDNVLINKTHKLLIVEDNAELLNILKDIFDPYYIIFTANNGKEGLDLSISKKPDLIVSDIMMPEMTGIEMCMQIKSNIALCHIPVILLTALNTNEQNIEGLNSGADDYITKPFNAKILLARTNNLIKNRLLLQHKLNENLISEVNLEDMNSLVTVREFLLHSVNEYSNHS